MRFGLVTLVLFVALFATVPVNAAEEKKPAAKKGAHVAEIKDRLPSKIELREAMGMASEIMEQQRQKLIQERRRLEELKKEINGEIKKLNKLNRKMKSGSANHVMPRVGTSLDDSGQRVKEKLSKEQAAERKSRVRHIAKSLAAMSPKAAAVAISRMNDRLAVELLNAVDGKKVGKIFESMDAQRAAVLMQKVIETRTIVSPKAAGKKGAS